MSLMIVAGAALLTGAGCTYERPRPATIAPSYSYRRALPELSVERIWPVTPERTAQAAADEREHARD